ncbi:non-ribosomal peptide synthetase, partial [Corallococcus sicarius]
LAYLIYTSGSTGRPKGVAITQGNAVAFLHWALATYSPEELKGVLAATSLNFDLSVFELFAPLSSGGAVVVARNALHLAELPTAWEVTLINTVPSAMAQLVRLGAVPVGVRVINLAGEALPDTLAKQVYAVPSVRKLYNLYGPSEDTTYSTGSLVGREEAPLIGRPLPATRAYVLDAALQPVPVGVAGELYLAGEGQARGYLLRPDLTAERFVPEPYGPPGGRMYRTGDRVRYREDGRLEYLGRVDFQVKVRGFRIELGEVEAALRRVAALKDAVVVAKGEAADKRLVAYVVAKAGESLEVESLKAQLRQGLPEYMVPGTVVVLDALPLNANGKVDRKALPEPEVPQSGSTYLAPRTTTEARLAAIWAEVLRLPQVGVRDSFFELGGHSLLATQVVSRVRAELSVELPLRALFESPTVEGLAGRLAGLTSSSAPALTRISHEGPLPLSFAQQRLWLIDQLEPGSPLYNMPVAVRLDGTLRTDVLEHALQEVVRRHDALRTTFAQVDGEPVQVIHPEAVLPLELVDLTSVDATQREAEARGRMEQEMRGSFDLRVGPLVRTLLFKLAEREHILVVNMHHIISDGWSLGVLVREVSALYDAFANSLPSPLRELPVQYADYATWQRQWLQGEVLDAQLGYWKHQLSGAPAVLELPIDKPRPAVRSTAGSTLGFSLPRELTEKLRSLGHHEGGSLFMVLLAGWQALLSRYTGQDDLSVGSPIAGRTRAETEGLIGFFVNTLVLRAKVEDSQSFRSLLQQVRGTVLEAYEHQDVPFEKLVEVLQPARSLSHTPLFQTLLALQNVPTEDVRLPGLRLRGLDFQHATSKFDLSIFFSETPDGLQGELEYSTALFNRSTAERMATHLRTLLEAVAAKPEQSVAELPLLGAEERQRLLLDWNDTTVDSPTDVPVHVHFARQARRTPDAVALVQGEATLTYAQLDARANQLANHLRALGITPGARVGLAVERSFELVVALLAILKAGAAFVPVDRNAPVERIAMLLEDADVEVVLTHQPFASLLPTTGTRVWLDAQQDVLSALPTHAPDVDVDGESLAYVMFTSGSTGRPKGVCVPHRGITRLVLGSSWMRFGSDEVWSQVAPIAFDASTLEIWGALLHGAKLVLAPPHALSLEELAMLLRQHRVTTSFMTTALFEQMVLHQGEAVAAVPQVLTGGDVMPWARVSAHLPRLSAGSTLVHAYGPTENTTISTTLALHRDTVVEGPVPIGRPISNATAYVLDVHLRPVPVGVAGEVYVGGPGLAWGYLHRPDLTAERFVPHPFATSPGERLYRTGDKARWWDDGTLDFLGRVDFQVKVRGFRIELGEIETALRAAPGVNEAVVIAKGTDGDKRLIGYVTALEGHTLDVDTLKRGLKQHLPEYMVPSALRVLEALPLNANGKVDRKVLPEPGDAPRTSAFAAPRNATEEQLAALFTQVLHVERVGVQDDFFALGGHSLLATQLVSRVRAAFGVELPLRALFEAPTVEALAKRLEGVQRTPHQAPPLRPTSREGAIPLSFAQQRLWLLDQLQPGDISYNIPAALRLTGHVDVESLRRAFEALVQRHESLRTTLSDAHEEPSQRIQDPSVWDLPGIDVSSLPESQREEEAQRVAATEARRPFHLATGPLLRTTLVRLGEEEHLLLVTMHHIVSDGWSMGVFVRELAAFYAAFSTGSTPALAPLPVQYADFATWQREWLQGEALEAQMGYWKQQLTGAPAALELPTDRPRPPVQSHRGSTVPVRLSRPVSEALKALSHREGATPFMTLLATFQVLLSRYSGQDDINVGSPIAGRTQAETEGLIGFFVNTLVLRAHVKPHATFRELLAQVRGTTLAAYEHQHLPFEKLVEAVQPARDLSRSALFQAMFSLQNAATETLRVPGLSFQPVDVAASSAKFDLTLTLQESPQGFVGSLTYATDLFDASTVQRMAGHLGVLLEAIATTPDTTLANLPLLTDTERQRLLVDWNGPRVDFPRDTCIHDAFAAQARLTPDALAVVCREEQLTFRELDARANQLAHRLTSLGVGPDVRVVLCVERSVEALVGLLGTLKAGGAYVPIDPSYPREWLAHVLQDTGAPVVLTQKHLLGTLPPHSAHDLCLDSHVADLAHESREAPASGVSPEHLAYIIYTSGSTGRPKGVMIQHRSVLNLRLALASTVHTDAKKAERVSVNAPLSFDASVKQLIQVLDGHTLCIVPDEARTDVGELVKRIGQDALDVLDCSPAHLRLLLEEGLLARESVPRRVLVGGEAVDPATWSHLAANERMRVFNVYGPTECTVDATACAFDASPTPTIGRPLPNVRVYVLDRNLHPVPTG